MKLIHAPTIAADARPVASDRGQYGAAESQTSAGGGVLVVLGIVAGIYALSPGARHWYKHGRLPD